MLSKQTRDLAKLDRSMSELMIAIRSESRLMQHRPPLNVIGYTGVKALRNNMGCLSFISTFILVTPRPILNVKY